MSFHRWHKAAPKGQGLVEYALILVLVAIVTIIVVALLGEQIQSVFCEALISLGPNAPDVQACAAPHVQCTGDTHATGPITLEAIVTDAQGDSTITHVEFYIDGSLSRNEDSPRYCLGGGGATCNTYNVSSLGSGNHTVTAIAYDNDGNTGQCSVNITVP